MGPYLAQPNLEKTSYKAENLKLKLRFARCEMQGNLNSIQVGEGIWKMQQYHNSTSAEVTPSSECSTDMEVVI
jgi:hypothetical protein